MDNQEKDKKEQEKLERWYKGRIKFQTVFLNIICVIMVLMGIVGIVRYLLLDTRTAKDNEQLQLGIWMLVAGIFLFLLCNYWLEKGLERLVGLANKSYKNKNDKKRKNIKDLDSALLAMSQQQGVVVWDTIWGVFAVSMIVMFIVFFDTCNKPVVIGIILFFLVMLFGGHVVGIKISRNKKFDKRLCKYSKMYIDYTSEEDYMDWLNQSIGRGVLSFTGFWILTDEFMVGRMWDISYEPVAIPRVEIESIVFFYEKRYESPPQGILQLHLKNGKKAELVLGRGGQDACELTLYALNENGIPWVQGEMRYY